MNSKPLEFFENVGEVKALFSTMESGNMKGDWEGAPENREKFVGKYFPGKKLVFAYVGHIGAVALVGKGAFSSGGLVNKVDALITDDRDVVLGLTGADCFPVFMYNSDRSVIGLIHGSIHSIGAGIIENTVDAMAGMLRRDIKSVRAVVGPGICKKHYDIKREDAYRMFPDERLRRFVEVKKYNASICMVDISGIIRHQLVKAGLQAKNVELSQICTFSHVGADRELNLFSYRRMGRPDPVLAGIATISLVE